MTDLMKRVVADAIRFYAIDATDGDLLLDDFTGVCEELLASCSCDEAVCRHQVEVEDALDATTKAIAPAVEQFKAALEQVAATFHKKEEPND